MPLVRRTRAILRSAEFGFLGVIVRTWRQTPRFCGAPGIGTWRWRRLFQFLRIAGALILEILARRPWRTSWLIVGTKTLPLSVYWLGARQDGRNRSLAEPTDPGDTKAEFSKWRDSVSNVVRPPRTARTGGPRSPVNAFRWSALLGVRAVADGGLGVGEERVELVLLHC